MIRFAETGDFAEWAATSNFSFLRGASHPEELVAQAIMLGLAAIGIADRNSLAGVVRAHLFLRHNKEGAQGLRVQPGSRLVFCDGTPDILAYPRNRAGYGRLTRLLTTGNARARKGACLLTIADLLHWGEDLQLIALPVSTFDPAIEARLAERRFAVLADGAEDGEPGEIESWTASPREAAAAPTPEPGGPVDPRIIPFPVAGRSEDPAPDPAKDRQPPDRQPLDRLAAAFPDRLWIGAVMDYGPTMRGDLLKRRKLAERLRLPLLATNDVVMHDPARRELLDVLTCIRHATTLPQAGRKLAANAERHLKPADEMRRLFAEAPEAVGETLRFGDGLAFSLDELGNDYPEELREGYASPQEALTAFAAEGARRRFPPERYPEGVPAVVTQAIAHELDLVAAKNYAPYFLTVHDIVRHARHEKILCQGRGSAANSTLCYCLGITDVDPLGKSTLLFERFISTERDEPPDIDVDFEHERREEVMQYIYRRYGRERAALTATVVTYRARSAIREVGKAFGLSEDAIGALAATVWAWSEGSVDEAGARRAGMDPSEAGLSKVIALARELTGFPRHLSQHTGGFVITRSRLDAVMPIANAAMDGRTTVEWDKDDLDALGILKVDVLALGILSALRGGFDLLARHYGRPLALDTLPAEDPAVYAMIGKADTIGVFQIESRAQMSMLPRLKPACFYDLVIEVAIVRPGPIQGDMVHPYLRRRTGKEKVVYPSPALEAVLGKTLGVPLFQEQAMQIAIRAAGFTPGEADRLRRAMATFKRVGTISTLRDRFVKGMVANDYPEEFAANCFKQIEGFGTYGFPEAHAASFALLVYASAWMKCRYPDVFACALLNAQPMGFYAPAQIVRDVRDHGVAVAEVDVNFSEWDCTLFVPSTQAGGQLGCDVEAQPVHARHAPRAGDILGTHAIRLGFRQVKGLARTDVDRLVAAREAGPAGGFDSVRDLWLRSGLTPAVLARLAEADAFHSLGLDRREALWIVRGLNRAGDKDDLPLLKALSFVELEPEARLPPMPLGQHVVEDYRHLSLSLKAHPVAFVRDQLPGFVTAEALAHHPDGARVTVAGLVLVRQRPGSAKGTIFLTLEDETGVSNIIVWPKLFEALRPVVIGARFISVTGRVQRDGRGEDGVIHVIADRADDLTRLLGLLSRPGVSAAGRDAEMRDEARPPLRRPVPNGRQARQAAQRAAERASLPQLFDTVDNQPEAGLRQVLPKGRNFH